MGFAAAIIAGLGVISAALGTLSILQVPSDPIISAKLTWAFWLLASVILFLLSIVLLLGRKRDVD